MSGTPVSKFSHMWLQKIKERLLSGLNTTLPPPPPHTPFSYILKARGQEKSSSGEGIENKNYLLTFDYHFLCGGSFVYIISDIRSSQALFTGGSKSKTLYRLPLHQPHLLLLLPYCWVEGEERFSVKGDAINTTRQRIFCSLGRVGRQAPEGTRVRTT